MTAAKYLRLAQETDRWLTQEVQRIQPERPLSVSERNLITQLRVLIVALAQAAEDLNRAHPDDFVPPEPLRDMVDDDNP